MDRKRPQPMIAVLQVCEGFTNTYSKPKEEKVTNKIFAIGNKVGFVLPHDVRQLKYEWERIMVTTPAPCESGKWERFTNHAGFPKFVFGVYWSANHLLLMEDVHEWCYHHIDFEDIRNVYQLRGEK